MVVTALASPGISTTTTPSYDTASDWDVVKAHCKVSKQS